MRGQLARVQVAIGGLGLAAILLAGCGSSSETTDAATSGAGATTTTAPGAAGSGDPYAAGGTTTTAATGAAATVRVATNATLGQLLVGPDGRTLYLFEMDKGTTSACTGACTSVWPALTATGTPTAGPGVTASLLTTVGGQVAYNGHLLYYYAGDKAAGEVNGKLVASWFPVSPAGNKVP